MGGGGGGIVNCTYGERVGLRFYGTEKTLPGTSALAHANFLELGSSFGWKGLLKRFLFDKSQRFAILLYGLRNFFTGTTTSSCRFLSSSVVLLRAS